MKKVTILGTSVYGLENFGDEALLYVLVRELRNNIKNVEITWIARHPESGLHKLYGIDKVIKNIEHDSKEQSLGRWFWGLNPGDSNDHLVKIRENLEETDLLIIGGDPFSEISLGFNRGLAPYTSLMITLSKFIGIPVMLYSIHMGRPLKSDYIKELTKYCIENSKIVTLREEFSKKVLENMNIMTNNTIVLADSAWGLDPVNNKEMGSEILKKEKIVFRNDRVVGVNFRHHYWEWNLEKWQKHRDIVIQACDYLVEKMGVDLLFIPNCTYDIDHKYEDDRPGSLEIAKNMKNSTHAHVVLNKYNLFETLSLFPFLDMHISNRRHSLVFAALHSIPPLAIGGEWHVKPAMDELSIGDKFIKIEDLNIDLLKKRINETWNEKLQIKNKIKDALPELKKKAIQQGKVAADLIKRDGGKKV